MSTFDNPFDPQRRLYRTGCSCGRHVSQVEHDAVRRRQLQCAPVESEDKRYEGVVASAVMRAVFPKDAARRAFLKSVGASTALAALSQFFPLATATEVFAQGGADREEGPQGRLHPDHLRDADHHGAPDGLLCQARAQRRSDQDRRLGGDPRQDAEQGIRRRPHALADAARDHAGRRLAADPLHHAGGREHQRPGHHARDQAQGQARSEAWKGFKFAVPFDYSMHNYLLRYYLAEHGLDPDTDVQIRAVPPPEMVANLRADNIDGFLGPDPVNQRAVYDGVGFIHMLSKEIWDGHPCCAFAASREFVTAMPNTYAALLKAIIDATAFASKPENRKQIAEAIAPANYLNQPVTVVEQILTGTFADGLGNVKRDPNRIDFDPFPWESFAVWILTQMKRWGQIKGDVDYQAVAKQVYPRDRHRQADEGGRADAADHHVEDLRGDGQDLRSGEARGLHQELRDQANHISLDQR